MIRFAGWVFIVAGVGIRVFYHMFDYGTSIDRIEGLVMIGFGLLLIKD